MKPHHIYFPSTHPLVKAVTLVVHGLNVKPMAMHFFVDWLNKQGSDVYLVRLSGHDKASEPMHKVTKGHWESEMIACYLQANAEAQQNKLPLFCLGYSLGALLAQTLLLLSGKNYSFDKQVLLSPAIAIRPRSYVLKSLFPFGHLLQLPCFTPKEYGFNHWLPINIYKILFDEEKKYLQGNPGLLNLPTLVIMDPKDEMISYKKLAQNIKRKNLTNYNVLLLDHQLKGRSKKYHHLILDEQTMGKKNWASVSQKLQQFLFPE